MSDNCDGAGRPRITGGIDVGSSAIKTVLLEHHDQECGGACTSRGKGYRVIARRTDRLRHRDVRSVAEESYREALAQAGLRADQVDYLATTGEGELIEFRTGHFYGMTAHARGGRELVPEAASALDIGALHARAMVIDDRGRALRYRMTSQCASGSGQFLENIGRYLGVALEEIGPISLTADTPEICSGICAVLAETDVINMVSRGISTSNIVKGIHQSMAGRYLRLLSSAGVRGHVLVTGGLAQDVGLLAALTQAAEAQNSPIVFRSHERSALAGALGAALWGAFRARKLAREGVRFSAGAA